jgi:hypothetical protein
MHISSQAAAVAERAWSSCSLAAKILVSPASTVEKEGIEEEGAGDAKLASAPFSPCP